MTKEEYQVYLQSPEWAAVSKEVKRRAGYRCQACDSSLDLCAHHRNYRHVGNDMDHLDELICLCSRCHNLFHRKPEIVTTFTTGGGMAASKAKTETFDTGTVSLSMHDVSRLFGKRSQITKREANLLGLPGTWWQLKASRKRDALVGVKVPASIYRQVIP